MDEAMAARLKAQTDQLVEEISVRAKRAKLGKKATGVNPFTSQKVKEVKRASADSGAILLDEFDPFKVATDNAGDGLVRGPSGKLVDKGIDLRTIGKARRTSATKPD